MIIDIDVEGPISRQKERQEDTKKKKKTIFVMQIQIQAIISEAPHPSIEVYGRRGMENKKKESRGTRNSNYRAENSSMKINRRVFELRCLPSKTKE